jgi:hypothetical protein
VPKLAAPSKSEEIPEVPNPAPKSDEVTHAELTAFLAEHGIDAKPYKPKSFKSAEAAMDYILKSELFEIVRKDR